MEFSHPSSLAQMKGCGDANLLLVMFVVPICCAQWQLWQKPLWAPNFWAHLPSWMGQGSLRCCWVQQGVWHRSLLTLPDPWHGQVQFCGSLLLCVNKDMIYPCEVLDEFSQTEQGEVISPMEMEKSKIPYAVTTQCSCTQSWAAEWARKIHGDFAEQLLNLLLFFSSGHHLALERKVGFGVLHTNKHFASKLYIWDTQSIYQGLVNSSGSLQHRIFKLWSVILGSCEHFVRRSIKHKEKKSTDIHFLYTVTSFQCEISGHQKLKKIKSALLPALPNFLYCKPLWKPQAWRKKTYNQRE